MSAEAIAARNSLPWLERQLSMEQVTHHRLKAWGLSKITGLGLGLFAGLAGALAVLISGVVDFFLLPDRWARRYGALGFLTGLPATVAVAVLRPAYAALVLADRILTGTYNAAAQRLDPLGQRWPQVSTFDPLLSMSNTHHHTVKFLEAEISNIELAPQRVHALLRATERARGARAAYLTAARQGGRGAGGLTHMQGHVVVDAFATALERGRNSSIIGGSLGLAPEAVTKLASDVRGCGDFMSFTRFCLLLQPHLARQSKRIFQEHRPELSPSVRASDDPSLNQGGAASSADDPVPPGGREPRAFSLEGGRWERARRAALPWLLCPPWLPSLRRRHSTADLDHEGGEEEDEDFAEFSEAGSPSRRHGIATLERSATINAAAFSSIFHGMRRVASRTTEKEALAAQRERGVSLASRWAVRAQEVSSSAASQCSSAIALRVGDTNRASSIWASRKNTVAHGGH